MIIDEDIDRSKLRYVLYARRSTTDEGSQIRSIPDQVKYCERHAKVKGLNVVATFQEKGSAKTPDKRNIFTEILKEVDKGGKYDAILSYAPDRLSRNMLEGGQIINLLDEGKLKDLQFPTHHFTNDPTGKLTLGIMFSISKHFSDNLSRKVRRGVSGNFDDGKSSGSPKWGYDRNELDGLYKPNDFFNTIQESWYLRAKGATNKSVLVFLLEQGYDRMTKINKKNKVARKILPTEKTVGNMFKDPFYYGVLEQTHQTVDLRELYNFEPMIEVDIYDLVQALAYTRKRDINPKKMLEFKPLTRMVYCGVCKSDRWMLAGKNKPGGSDHHVLSYRCDNPECTRYPKSVRAKYVFEAIYAVLDRVELSDEAYDRYSERIDGFTDEKIIKIKKQIASTKGAYAHKKKCWTSSHLG